MLTHRLQSGGYGTPVLVLYYRVAAAGIVEIIRVLHERMEPQRHLEDPRTRRRGSQEAKRVRRPL